MAKTRVFLPKFVRILALILAPLLIGCGGAKMHPVSGTVSLDGKPVVDAGIMFHPKAGGPVASAVTDAAGKYTLICMDKNLLPPGEYAVTVHKQKVHATTTVKEKSKGKIVTKEKKLEIAVGDDGLESESYQNIQVEWLVPEIYSKIDASGLVVQVPPASSDSYQIKLLSPK